ncbi:MAG: hypothetical protein LBH81_02975 [Rickettsiales bacterium]|jgi:hypothetical protein|nr:hypothetical protein [Rickettsiales bacterium]
MAKKSVKKTASKPAPKAAPVVKAAPAAKCGCGCGCGGNKYLKAALKTLAVLVIFGLGFATCCALCGKKCLMGKINRGGAALFDKNGCLNVAAMEKKMQGKFTPQQLSVADADGDGCITKEEFKNVRFGGEGQPAPRPKRIKRVQAPVQQ